MSKLMSIYLSGRLIGDEVTSYPKNDGTTGKRRTILVQHPKHSAVAETFEIPLDLKVTPDKDGLIKIEGFVATSGSWKDKKYFPNFIRYYIPQEK